MPSFWLFRCCLCEFVAREETIRPSRDRNCLFRTKMVVLLRFDDCPSAPTEVFHLCLLVHCLTDTTPSTRLAIEPSILLTTAFMNMHRCCRRSIGCPIAVFVPGEEIFRPFREISFRLCANEKHSPFFSFDSCAFCCCCCLIVLCQYSINAFVPHRLQACLVAAASMNIHRCRRELVGLQFQESVSGEDTVRPSFVRPLSILYQCLVPHRMASFSDTPASMNIHRCCREREGLHFHEFVAIFRSSRNRKRNRLFRISTVVLVRFDEWPSAPTRVSVVIFVISFSSQTKRINESKENNHLF